MCTALLPTTLGTFLVVLKKQQIILRYISVARLGRNCIKGTLRVHFCSSDKTELSECAVCENLAFSEVLCGRNNSAVMHVIETNPNTSALQSATQCWAANAVSTVERRLGHRRQSSANVSVTGKKYLWGIVHFIRI